MKQAKNKLWMALRTLVLLLTGRAGAFLTPMFFCLLLSPWARAGESIQDQYAKIPCPTAKSLRSLIKNYSLDVDFKNFKCEPRDTRTYLVKSLSQISQMNYQTPAEWGAAFGEMTSDLAGYIRRYVSKIRISAEIASSTVVNAYPAEGIIELTYRINEMTPLEVVSLFVHEIRHIEMASKVHIRCATGDMPGTDVACDELFTWKHSGMSSYNIEVAFMMGLALYNQNVTEAVRKEAVQTAMQIAASRFNNFKDRTVYFQDAVLALNSSGQLQVWHPQLKMWLLLPVPDLSEPIARIQPSTEAFSAYLFTQSGRVFVWNPFKPLRELAESVAAQGGIDDIQRMLVPAYQDDLLMGLVSKGEVKLQVFDSSISGKKWIPFPLLAPNQFPGGFRRIISGFYNEVLFLDQAGRLWRQNRINAEPDFSSIAELDQLGPWIGGAPGLSFDQLFLINQKGKIFNFSILNKQDLSFLKQEESSSEEFVLKEMPLPFAIRKYQQGSQGEYFLSVTGKLNHRSFHAQDLESFAAGTVQDFVVLKNLVVDGLPAQVMKMNLLSVKPGCQLQQTQMDPTTYLPIGLNQKNELTFVDYKGRCLVAGSKKIKAFEFRNHTKFDESYPISLMENGINFKSHPELFTQDENGQWSSYKK